MPLIPLISTNSRSLRPVLCAYRTRNWPNITIFYILIDSGTSTPAFQCPLIIHRAAPEGFCENSLHRPPNFEPFDHRARAVRHKTYKNSTSKQGYCPQQPCILPKLLWDTACFRLLELFWAYFFLHSIELLDRCQMLSTASGTWPQLLICNWNFVLTLYVMHPVSLDE
jgi:hypothetical protein